MLYKNDIKVFIKKLTIKKTINALQIITSYYLSKILKKPIQWGLPLTLSIEPTTACNLRCPECPSGLRAFTRPTGMLQKNFFEQTLAEVADSLLYLYFYFQGEPYLNPHFLDMVQYAHQKGVYTVTSTNAHFLTPQNAQKTVEAGLSRLIISLDGTTQETYQQYRIGGNLEKVLQGTKNLVEAKKKLNSKTPHIIFQFLVVRPNEHQIQEAYELAQKIGVDELKLKTAQIYDPHPNHPLIPQNPKYSRYHLQPNGTYNIKNELLNHCWKLWHSAVITWNGSVVPCCFDKDATHHLGSLQYNTFKQVWHSTPYRNFRKKILNSRKNIDICANCSEGTKVWA